MIGAFLIGFVLLNAVLLIPALQRMFEVAALSVLQLIAVYGLALSTFIIIQPLKMMIYRKK